MTNILNKIIIELEIHIKACVAVLNDNDPKYENAALDRIQAYRDAIRIVRSYQ
jgi:hypothetical protein